MPELSTDLTEADLVSWLVKPGDRVAKGDLLCELETEKSTVEFESPVSGTLLEILVPEGTNEVQVGTVIALFEVDTSAEPPAAPRPEAAPPKPEPAPPSAPAAPPPAAARAERAETPAPRPSPAPESPAPPPSREPDREAGGKTATATATALARRVAEQAGVALSGVTGSGPGGRILKADVQAAAAPGATDIEADGEGETAPSLPASAPRSASASATPFTAVPLTRMRRTIATRLAEAKRSIPHFYLRVECEIGRLQELRARWQLEDRRVSVNDFVVRASALALVEVPEANVSFGDDVLLRYERVDVAVAVATDGGLLTPIVREADRKELDAIAAELRDLAGRARTGKLAPHEYQGGSFTVSNLGMYGVESVYPIVNPPQACILGVGAGEERPVVRDGALAVATVMTCTLCADHRAVDGAVGARLLGAIKRRLEDPLEMLL
jgi:pyruvate dehydrogenase E2 component (dihydrolipoamide acetyltransferase)